MRTLQIRRPSPALVVALVALVAALGGTSYAAFRFPKNSVGSKQLKNRAVTTKKIKNGTVTGSKINLSTVGTVPNANHANSANTAGTATTAGTAANATNAASVDGAQVSAFEYSAQGGSTNSVVLNNFDGLTLDASCTAGSADTDGLTVTATSAVAGGSLGWSGIAKGGSKGGASGSTGSNAVINLPAGTPETLMNPNSIVDTGNGGGGLFGQAIGQIIYSQYGGSRVTVDWAYDGNFGAGNPPCYFTGTAVGTPSGPSSSTRRPTAAPAGSSATAVRGH
jgi:hypothetical protein